MDEIIKSLHQKSENKIRIKKSLKDKLTNFTQKITKFWTTQSNARKAAIQFSVALLIVGLGYVGGLFTRPAKIEIQKQRIETLSNNISDKEEEFTLKRQEVENLDSQIAAKRQEVSKLDSAVIGRTQELDSINGILAAKIKQNEMLGLQQNDSLAGNLQTVAGEQLTPIAETQSVKPVRKVNVSELNIDAFQLCKDGNLEAFSKIVENYPDFDINQENNNYRSYTYTAVKNDKNGSHRALINYIAGVPGLDAGMNHANWRDDMHYWCVGGYDEAVQIYLDKHQKFDINKDDNNRHSYTYTAIDNDKNGSHRKLINILAGFPGLDANKEHGNARTDFYYWCRYGYYDAIKIYLDKHPDFDINKKDWSSGKTYIEVAQRNKHYDIVNLLLDFQMKQQ